MTKNQILEAAFPDSLFTTPTGTADVEKLAEDVNVKVDTLLNTPQIPQVSSVQLPSSLRGLLPALPTIELPSPAEIREFVNKKLDMVKKKAQEQNIKELTNDAVKENKPFSARRDLINSTLRKNTRG